MDDQLIDEQVRHQLEEPLFLAIVLLWPVETSSTEALHCCIVGQFEYNVEIDLNNPQKPMKNAFAPLFSFPLKMAVVCDHLIYFITSVHIVVVLINYSRN